MISIENEVSRNEEELTKLVSHEIPNSDNQLLFELDEVQTLHSTMAKQLSNK